MNETETSSGAGPAIAAHSKDGSAPGQTPASSATGNKGETGGMSASASGLSDKTREGLQRLKTSVGDTTERARATLSGQSGRAADQAAEFVREQPLVALAVAGAVCLALGWLLGRR